jgi:hypothetical protein
LEKRVIKSVTEALLHTAVQQHFDVRIRGFDAAATDWTPSKPLDLRDFRPSMASAVFQGQGDRERQAEQDKRFQAALSSLEAYFREIPAKSQPCSRLLNVAREIASESFPITVLVLSETICSSPQMTLRLPSDRTLVALFAAVAVRDEGRQLDCAVIARERQLKATFPHVVVIPMISEDTLAEILLKGETRPVSVGLEVHGCNPAPAAPRVRTAASLEPKVENFPQDVVPVRDSGLRIISPQHHAHVGRIVPFQGDGARPGETLVPMIRVGDEYWPQTFVHANKDGSYGGEVIVGRFFNDCGITVEFRVYGNVQQPIAIGRPLGSWPSASEASLPIKLTRTEECSSMEVRNQ